MLINIGDNNLLSNPLLCFLFRESTAMECNIAIALGGVFCYLTDFLAKQIDSSESFFAL